MICVMTVLDETRDTLIIQVIINVSMVAFNMVNRQNSEIKSGMKRCSCESVFVQKV